MCLFIRFSLTLLILEGISGCLQGQNHRIYRDSTGTQSYARDHIPSTFCNPMNIDYAFEFYNDNSSATPFRSTADPTIVRFKGDYYLFATNQKGYWWSPDLSQWHYVYSSFARQPADDDLCAPTAFSIGDTLYLVGSFSFRAPIFMTTNPKEGRWTHAVDSLDFDIWDPAFFVDDDRRVYLYWGSSNFYPIKCVELDPYNQFKPLGEARELLYLDPGEHGWERFGENNDSVMAPFIEGPWMTNYKNHYYLQYAAPGTEFKVYADGVYLSDDPMGPFTYQPYNPFSYKPGGFITGAGHGSTFQDEYGNYWHVATSMLSDKYKFERRIGLYPAGFDTDGQLFVNTSFGDYPAFLPKGKEDHLKGNFTGWMLLSFKKDAIASSSEKGYPLELAFDEDIRTYWSSQSADSGEWLQVDIGHLCRVNAIQINYADHKATQYGKAMDMYHQYQVFHSIDGMNWSLLIDKSYNDRDVPHDYVELSNSVTTRYIKLVNIHMATGNFAISGLRVFGNGFGLPPEPVKEFYVDRQADRRNAVIHWKKAADSFGYNILYGITPDKLYNCITVYDTDQYDFRGLDSNTTYYFTIETFNENGVSQRIPPIKR
ncbi:MAG: family 43 glycosylhydrolase [Bacteroidetes bacterium]|nr:family 43 glycosylhydrolase [Bacteroidota bacterium]